MQARRQKNSNFTALETNKLIDLVQKYRRGITCNKTDLKIQIRKEAWQKISDEFNSGNQCFRPVECLKNKYKNIKAASMRKFSENKSYTRRTGGGPPKSKTITKTDEIIKEIHGTQVTGGASNYDGDSLKGGHEFPAETDNNNIKRSCINISDGEDLNAVGSSVSRRCHVDIKSPSVLFEYNVEDLDWMEIENPEENASEDRQDHVLNEDLNLELSTCSNWSAYNPTKLRQPKTKALTITNKSGEGARKRSGVILKTKIAEWTKTKVELNNLQLDCFKEQHKLKLQHNEDKHKKEIHLLEEEKN